MQETNAAPLSPTEAAEPPSPASLEPVQEQSLEPRPEEAAPLGDEAGAEEAPKSWGDITDRAAILEHEDFRSLVDEKLEKSSKEAYDKAYHDVQARMQPLAVKGSESMASIDATIKQLSLVLRRAQEDGSLNQRATEDLLLQHGPALEALGGKRRADGVKDTMGGLAQLLGLTMNPEVEMGHAEWAAGKSADTTFLSQFAADIKASVAGGMVSKADADEMVAKAKETAIKEYKAAYAATQQVQGGAPVGALAPGSPAGGRSEEELLADPATPIETIMEIRARQKAGR